ncbi:hypothetical protein GOP47_0020092 [Adiantum capillus-veneris]|uniref:Myb-like domain-containing protein n=1 Tax=Adiantum capillus-veneris TaxID=13818 RepID=A0A9D4UD05_ADICA|nr:hypothetical protein GOP47_0020092 [Adiantum capillus-veneris]
MALRPQHQQQQQQSWPESLAAMAAFPLHMNPALLVAGGAADMGATPSHVPPHVPSHGSVAASSLSMVSNTANGAKREERMGQWSYQETKDFIAIRSELERDFTHAKRNKSLWETIASKMKERGYNRSGEQCKLKWKNLYNRYKAAAISQGTETCPFYEELHAIFSDPHRALDGLCAEPSSATKSRKGALGERSSEDLSDDDDDDDEESEEDNKVKRPIKKARKADVRERVRPNAEKCRANSMQEVLEEFFQQQQRMEMEWMEALHRREDERRRREQEWREAMEKLERERIAREEMWRDREDQRRSQEEMRARKRDALFSALLSRLTKEE